MSNFRRKCSDICLSLPISLAIFAIAAVIVLLRQEVIGVLIFVGILSLLLALCDDITVTTLPFLLVCMFVLKCYDSFNTFIVFAPLGAIPIAAFLFHVFANRTRLTIGKSFWGVVAVAVSVTLGGVGSISASEYFSPTSIFYLVGLGIGMVAIYLIMKREFTPSDRYSLVERLFAIFYMAGFFGMFMLISHVFLEWDSVMADGIRIQWSNNLSTMMMFFLPIPFYYAITKSRWHYLVGILFYVTIAMTRSRGGLLMGGIELLLCFLFVSIKDKPLRYVSILTVTACVVTVALSIGPLLEIYGFGDTGVLISPEEGRVRLLKASIKDFLNNPIFGQGIGYTGNCKIYKPVTGAANWYHMMIPQIIGSFGSVGILCYGYQFVSRVLLIFKKPTVRLMTIGISYAGILLMTQVNPGEFCPLPYEMLTVLLFIFAELPREELTREKRNAFTSLFVK